MLWAFRAGESVWPSERVPQEEPAHFGAGAGDRATALSADSGQSHGAHLLAFAGHARRPLASLPVKSLISFQKEFRWSS